MDRNVLKVISITPTTDRIRDRSEVNSFSPEHQLYTFANRIDLDKMANIEPSHQDLYCILFCSLSSLTPLFTTYVI